MFLAKRQLLTADNVAFGKLGPGLPAVIRTRRADQIDAVAFVRLRQMLGVKVAGVHELGLREQTLLREGFVDEGGGVAVGHRGGGGLHVGDDARKAILAGLGEMDSVAHPGGGGLPGVAAVRVDRRAACRGL